MFEGDISAEEEVLDWLIEMKVESHIELITRAMLETMVEEVQYLAVYFCKTEYPSKRTPFNCINVFCSQAELSDLRSSSGGVGKHR